MLLDAEILLIMRRKISFWANLVLNLTSDVKASFSQYSLCYCPYYTLLVQSELDVEYINYYDQAYLHPSLH